ncbi:hypothetical protein ACJMK2_017845 [Sinanodonta woodiana]|uniref:Uncharacterized protein n=1 Tax=Sinanodonta woodiana TaxID=1069815 RepID=A0ABD3UEA2_SINWO
MSILNNVQIGTKNYLGYQVQKIILQRESDSNAVIKVELGKFGSKNDVNCSFASGGLRIAATVDDEVFSKKIDGLTDKHVDVTDIRKSNGSFSVVLKKKKEFDLSEMLFGK